MPKYKARKRSAGKLNFGPGDEIELTKKVAEPLVKMGAIVPFTKSKPKPATPSKDDDKGDDDDDDACDKLLSELEIDAKVLGLLSSSGILTVGNAKEFDEDKSNEKGLESIEGIDTKTAEEIRKAIA